MRSSGPVAAARGYGCSDHVCWAYSSRSERDEAAVDWLLDGAGQGQRLVVVTGDADGGDALRAAVERSPGAGALREGVVVFRMQELYDLSRPIDPPAQLAIYAGAVEQAVAEGFNGVRVFADITALIADPARHHSHAVWEHYADAWIAEGNPLAPLCAYDAAALDEQPEAIMALHPLRRRPDTASAGFGLYWGPEGRVLDGEIDAFGVDALADALAALPDEPLDIDVSGLRFINGGGAAALARARNGEPGRPPLRLVGARPMVRRVWDVLGLEPGMLSA